MKKAYVFLKSAAPMRRTGTRRRTTTRCVVILNQLIIPKLLTLMRKPDLQMTDDIKIMMMLVSSYPVCCLSC